MAHETERPRLLVADDDLHIRSLVRRIVEADGWFVATVGSGEAAIAAVAADAFELVLIALELPDLSGAAATAMIRKSPVRTAAVPIVGMTALQHGRSQAYFRGLGMDGHLVKPFTPEQLRERVDAWRPAAWRGSGLTQLVGARAAADLVAQFGNELAAAMDSLDGSTSSHETAHCIAGAAGTLGFAEIHASWLALSQGDESARSPARRAARKLLSTLGMTRGCYPTP